MVKREGLRLPHLFWSAILRLLLAPIDALHVARKAASVGEELVGIDFVGLEVRGETTVLSLELVRFKQLAQVLPNVHWKHHLVSFLGRDGSSNQLIHKGATRHVHDANPTHPSTVDFLQGRADGCGGANETGEVQRVDGAHHIHQVDDDHPILDTSGNHGVSKGVFQCKDHCSNSSLPVPSQFAQSVQSNHQARPAGAVPAVPIDPPALQVTLHAILLERKSTDTLLPEAVHHVDSLRDFELRRLEHPEGVLLHISGKLTIGASESSLLN
mmetsp:Transcript_62509/g.132101  ORF Transcript_62509/g.132101 Transcript_62509/m.132101 type:complete len:270 (+) Transcript_62509:779-1588(+)